MKAALREQLAQHVLGLADDELILAHRNSEWTGHAPILEEDIAFANIALDELGHAALWYQIVAELRHENRDSYPDELVYTRAAAEFRSAQLVELPKGDWAFSITRQYLFDVAEHVRLAALAESQFAPLSEVAGKIRAEERYHLRHSQAWVRRLGLGTEESNRRMQRAVDELLPHTAQLFESHDNELAVEESLPDAEAMHAAWMTKVSGEFERSNLALPEEPPSSEPDRSVHSEHLEPLVAELQVVARSEAEAAW